MLRGYSTITGLAGRIWTINLSGNNSDTTSPGVTPAEPVVETGHRAGREYHLY